MHVHLLLGKLNICTSVVYPKQLIILSYRGDTTRLAAVIWSRRVFSAHPRASLAHTREIRRRRRSGRRLGLAKRVVPPPAAQRLDQQHAGVHVPVQDADAG